MGTLQTQVHVNEQSHAYPENGKKNGVNGVKYVTLKQDQYRQIIEYVNQLKNKMKKYHGEFQKNRDAMVALRESKEALEQQINDEKEKKEQVEKAQNAKRKWMKYAFLLFLIAAA